MGTYALRIEYSPKIEKYPIPCACVHVYGEVCVGACEAQGADRKPKGEKVVW